MWVGLLRRRAPRNDVPLAVIASRAKQSRKLTEPGIAAKGEPDANGRFLADPITHWQGRESRVWVGLSRSLGSNAIDGLAGPRMASPGGELPFPIWRLLRPLRHKADLQLALEAGRPETPGLCLSRPRPAAANGPPHRPRGSRRDGGSQSFLRQAGLTQTIDKNAENLGRGDSPLKFLKCGDAPTRPQFT
jgi:hypothetical protein